MGMIGGAMIGCIVVQPVLDVRRGAVDWLVWHV